MKVRGGRFAVHGWSDVLAALGNFPTPSVRQWNSLTFQEGAQCLVSVSVKHPRPLGFPLVRITGKAGGGEWSVRW